MKIERGSTWGKWDFHIHTPYSTLNNGYGFTPGNGDSVLFDTYVKNLFQKAVDKEIVAIGITDYFSIDGYKRIKQEYLDDEMKMAQLFPDEEFRNKVNAILVFPNIEMRLDSFVGSGSHAVNYHVLFSDRIDVTDIEESFLQRLKLIHTSDGSLPMTRKSIERIGQEYKQHNPIETRPDYIVGLERITVNHLQVTDVLKTSAVLSGQYLVSIPVDEDLSLVNWQGRDYQTRKVLYQKSDLLMTSNENTKNWALAKGHEQEQISEFGSIKPCIWGSDAHSYDDLFSPSKERFCWIKAKPTFEGLQQVLYEPDDRVRIQKTKPEEKDIHQIIDCVVFDDDRFQQDPIYLSEGLTTIIGGKSTGKSILLRHIAKSIDSKQVDVKERKATGILSKLNVNAQVVWKDGVAGERKIIYIPQSWLNRIVDEKSGDSELNIMIKEILLQQKDISDAYNQLNEQIDGTIKAVKHDILDYVAAYQKANESERSLREFGRSEAFQAAITRLKKQQEEMSAEAGLTDDMLLQYSALDKEIAERRNTNDVIEKEEQQLDSLGTPVVIIPNISKMTADGIVKYSFDEVPTAKDQLTGAINQLNEMVREAWGTVFQSVKEAIEKKKNEGVELLEVLLNDFRPLQQLVLKNDLLKSIDIQLQDEQEKYRKAKSIEKTKEDNLVKADALKKKILASRQSMRDIYDEFVRKVSEENLPDSDLVFLADVQEKRSDLFEAINTIIDNRNLRSFRDRTHYNVLDKEDFSVDDGLFEALWDAMTNGSLSFKGGNTLQTCLERLFSNWFYVHFAVKSENDTINSMSPGKKALVLLEMIVNLEKSKCPILIDQPEDDLDNRSIFADLVTYLKSKKRERQIVVVTHNANVVVGADAEEVIIANQDGKEAPNRLKQFEYRCGAIETTNPLWDDTGRVLPGVLNKKGVQEQICDILEGGKVAFELRRKKYIGN